MDGNRKELTSLYNRAGAIEKVLLDGNAYIRYIAYDAKGQRVLATLGNDIITRYAYDPNTYRLLRLKSEKYTLSQNGNDFTYTPQAGTSKQDIGYSYDLVGNIVKMTHKGTSLGIGGTDSLERDFVYDPVYRLLEATGRENVPGGGTFPGWDDTTRSDDANTTTYYKRKFSYSKSGNLQTMQHVGSSAFTRTFNYQSGNNKLEGIAIGSDNYSFGYDEAGNLTLENSNRHMEWDYAGNLRCFYNKPGATSEPTVYTHYLYAGKNRVKKLTRKKVGGSHKWQVTIYIDGLFEHSYEKDAGQTIDTNRHYNTLHISGGARLRVGTDTDDSTPAIKYQLTDHLSSVGVTLDSNGTLVSREEYYPYGETSFGSYGKKRYRFTGKEKDEESGLYYYGARYYAPWTARFTSIDPMAGSTPGISPYIYANCNPVMMNDPTGMQSEKTGGESRNSSNCNVSCPSNSNQSNGNFTATNPLGEGKVAVIAADRIDKIDRFQSGVTGPTGPTGSISTQGSVNCGASSCELPSSSINPEEIIGPVGPAGSTSPTMPVHLSSVSIPENQVLDSNGNPLSEYGENILQEIVTPSNILSFSGEAMQSVSKEIDKNTSYYHQQKLYSEYRSIYMATTYEPTVGYRVDFYEVSVQTFEDVFIKSSKKPGSTLGRLGKVLEVGGTIVDIGTISYDYYRYQRGEISLKELVANNTFSTMAVGATLTGEGAAAEAFAGAAMAYTIISLTTELLVTFFMNWVNSFPEYHEYLNSTDQQRDIILMEWHGGPVGLQY